MTDERQRSDEEPGAPHERDPQLDREEVKDLTPSDDDAQDVRGGARCACTDTSGGGGTT